MDMLCDISEVSCPRVSRCCCWDFLWSERSSLSVQCLIPNSTWTVAEASARKIRYGFVGNLASRWHSGCNLGWDSFICPPIQSIWGEPTTLKVVKAHRTGDSFAFKWNWVRKVMVRFWIGKTRSQPNFCATLLCVSLKTYHPLAAAFAKPFLCFCWLSCSFQQHDCSNLPIKSPACRLQYLCKHRWKLKPTPVPHCATAVKICLRSYDSHEPLSIPGLTSATGDL